MTAPPSTLSPEDRAFFQEHGYVRVPEAFSRELALEMHEVVWVELERDHGISRGDPATWKAPRHGLRAAKHHPLNEKLASPRFRGAIDDLIGEEAWDEPSSWGGFLVTFPDRDSEPWDVPNDTWHWDGDPSRKGLLIFSFYSEVSPRGGGTLVLAGSPRLIASFYGSLSPEERASRHKVHRKMLAGWDPWLEELMGRRATPGLDRIQHFMGQTTEVRGVPLRVVELTGEPGDAVLCSPGILHAASANRSDEPRMMRVKFLGPESFRLESGARRRDARSPSRRA